MANARPIEQQSGTNQGPASCSVCLEVVKDVGERSIAKLACGHHFHLDCIGSAFNAKGTMQCPNCRQVEDGLWLFANGCCQLEDPLVSDGLNEDEYGLNGGASDLIIPHDFVDFGHFQWCPYQSSISQLSESPGDSDHPPAAYREAGRVLSRSHEHWPQWASAPSALSNGVSLLESGPTSANDGERISQSDVGSLYPSGTSLHFGDNGFFRRAGDTAMGTHNMVPVAADRSLYTGGFVQMAPAFYPINVSPNRRRRFPIETQPWNGLFVQHPPQGQVLPGLLSLDFVGISAVHNATVLGRGAEERDSRTFTHWGQEGWPPTFLQYPLQPALRRWILPVQLGSHGLHGIWGSNISSQASIRAPEAHFFNHYQGPFHTFSIPFIGESQIVNFGFHQPQASTEPLIR